MAKSELTGPSTAIIKRLFAQSDNRCAFPKCQNRLVEGETVVGEICHIKAQSPDGPRYDATQTAKERHGYGNTFTNYAAAVVSQFPAIDGFCYPSRLTGADCFAIFARAIGRLSTSP